MCRTGDIRRWARPVPSSVSWRSSSHPYCATNPVRAPGQSWNPGGFAHNIHDFIAQLIHRDIPLIDQAEDQFRLTTPADRIAVLVGLRAVEQPFLGKVLCNVLSYVSGRLPG